MRYPGLFCLTPGRILSFLGVGRFAEDLTADPRPGISPVSVRDGPRQAEGLGRLFYTHPSEVAELHKLGGVSVLCGQPGQRLVDGKYLVGLGVDREIEVQQVYANALPAMLLTPPTPRVL